MPLAGSSTGCTSTSLPAKMDESSHNKGRSAALRPVISQVFVIITIVIIIIIFFISIPLFHAVHAQLR